VTREMFLLPSELRLYQLRDESGVERVSHVFIIRNAAYGPVYQPVHPQIGSIAARSVDTLIRSQASGDLWTLYYEAKENDMSYQVTSIPEDFVDDSKSMFDRKYMTRLFNAGYELGKSGKAWRGKPSYVPNAPTTREAPAEPARRKTPEAFPAPQSQPASQP
jgi:hypothetical protein